MAKVCIIGAGFSGMSAAAHMAKAGHEVHVFEKNSMPGGRAQYFEAEGFKFDMGPSWYWMPEVFERHYQLFGHTQTDFYQLDRLDPSYQVIFPDGKQEMPANLNELAEIFEQLEPGASKKLDKFLKDAAVKYEVGMEKMVFKPGLSIAELLDPSLIKYIGSMQLFNNMQSYVRKNFKHKWIREILEFPVLFLGGQAKSIPALYSLMNYADLALGTWYPQGGMHEIAKAFHQIALEQGVQFHFNKELESVEKEGSWINKLRFRDGEEVSTDLLINSGDYNHFDKKILKKEESNYSDQYWEKRKMSPSSILYFIGLKGKVNSLLHHNLFFDSDFATHANAIYKNPSFAENPLFYVCCPSKTDKTVAPENGENLFILIPTAPGLPDSEEVRNDYFNKVIHRLEKFTGEKIKDRVLFKRDFGYQDFRSNYFAFKGNAYGLANTLGQTANLKPSIRSKHLINLYHTGQLTVPGPGVPPSIISGEMVAKHALKHVLS